MRPIHLDMQGAEGGQRVKMMAGREHGETTDTAAPQELQSDQTHGDIQD